MRATGGLAQAAPVPVTVSAAPAPAMLAPAGPLSPLVAVALVSRHGGVRRLLLRLLSSLSLAVSDPLCAHTAVACYARTAPLTACLCLSVRRSSTHSRMLCAVSPRPLLLSVLSAVACHSDPLLFCPKEGAPSNALPSRCLAFPPRWGLTSIIAAPVRAGRRLPRRALAVLGTGQRSRRGGSRRGGSRRGCLELTHSSR